MARDHFKIERYLFADTIDMGYYLDDKQDPVIAGDEIKAPGTDGKTF
jgi:hypothetical protein